MRPRIAARRGNRAHAPENTRIAMISAWTSGADLLALDVRPTRDGTLVVAADATMQRLTGHPGEVAALPVGDLMDERYDVSQGFPDAGGYRYRDTARSPGRAVRVEVFDDLLDELPAGAELVVRVFDGPGGPAGAVAATLAERGLLAATLLVAAEPALVKELRAHGADLVAVDGVELSPAEQEGLVAATDADGLVTGVASVISGDGTLTALGRTLADRYAQGRLRAGLLVWPAAGSPDEALLDTLGAHECVRACLTDSLLVPALTPPGRTHVSTRFAGAVVDRRRFAFGYAKPHGDTRVWQDDGLHIEVQPYSGAPQPPAEPGLAGRVAALEQQMWYALGDWPFYSGGGAGLVRGIDGDFIAETTYRVDRVAQATTLEMAVVNVDPGAHLDRPPRSGRDQDPFYDPHGCPPFVGVEHDEDDGFRINWNLGHEYLANQYGTPCGDGTSLAGDLRLERRGAYFSAYYRNAATPGWICVGVTRNESLNSRVFLRCAGKRWRQERSGGGWYDIIANRWLFSRLDVRLTRYGGAS